MNGLFDMPFEEAGPPVVGPRRRVFTVSELTAEIRARLEGGLAEVWVEGEVSNCKLWSTGHLYFTLKDSAAQLKGVMFRTALRYLRFKPEDGLHVVARGRIGVYEPKGEYQLVCEHMEPHGLGARQLALEQLKKRLHAEGLFDPARKRALPALPRKIGVVTSIEGAAVHDILTVLARRHATVHVVIRPARVQGEGAGTDVARALAAIARVPGVDVIIVGRGGGSADDLWTFNEEGVARAIARSPVPVISAVGHEVDITLADFVADLRAPTPSAAAELVVRRRDEFVSRIAGLAARGLSAVRRRVDRARAEAARVAGRPGLAGWPARVALRGRDVAELTHALSRAATSRATRQQRRYDALRRRLEATDVRRRLGAIRVRLDAARTRLEPVMASVHRARASRLREATGRLETLSPLAVLARGYAVCRDDTSRSIIRDASAVVPGQRVRVALHRGELACEVRSALEERS